jgi:hypothetical protein
MRASRPRERDFRFDVIEEDLDVAEIVVGVFRALRKRRVAEVDAAVDGECELVAVQVVARSACRSARSS